jgi:putative transcriptional regulator
MILFTQNCKEKKMVKIHLSTLLGKMKWNQTDLVRATGIRPNAINDLYHEIAISVKIDHIDLICKALQCTSAELIEYIPDKK